MTLPVSTIPSKIIPSGSLPGQSIEKERVTFGDMAAAHYQDILYRLMDRFTNGAYQGGLWEMHQFDNGAVMWIFPEENQVRTHTLNGYDPVCSFYALSIALNVIVMSVLMGELANIPSQEVEVDKIAVNFDLAKDVGYALPERKAFTQIID